jgi:hypothetical protein
METTKKSISLGFTHQQFNSGVHICQIFNTDEERHGALIHFLISGIQGGESNACYSEKETESSLTENFSRYDISYPEVKESGAFSFFKTSEVYFEGGSFEPERMLNLIKQFYISSQQQGRSGARVIGEMMPEVAHIPGGSRLMEYESKISILLRDYPVTAICQYDAREFDGATIMDILKVHPYMIVRERVIHNPFFIQPEDYLSGMDKNTHS